MNLRAAIHTAAFGNLAAALLPIACILMIACSSNTEDATSSLGGVEVVKTPAYSSSVVPIDQMEPGDADQPRRGGMLTIDVLDCNIPDPAIDIAGLRHDFLYELPLVLEIHVGLMRHSDEHSIGAEPELAESYNVSDDGTLYEFTLRKDLTFSNGDRMTTDDVVWSWERALRKATRNSRANDILGNIVGADDILSGQSRELRGVRVIDERNLEVRLEMPRTDFPLLLADPVASVISSANEDKWGHVWANNPDFPNEIITLEQIFPEYFPIGAGPFAIAEYIYPARSRQGYSGQTRCVLTRNDRYWGRPANIDGIIARIHPDLLSDSVATFGRQKEEMASGELDIAAVRFNEIEEIPDTLTHVRMAEPPVANFVTLNPSIPPLDDARFRRALVSALDVDSKIRTVNGVPNENRLIPSSLYAEGSAVTASDFDLDLAKRELNASEHGASTEERVLQLSSISDNNYFFTYAIADPWKESLDIKVEVSELDPRDEILFEELQITDVKFEPAYRSPHSILVAVARAFGDGNDAPEVADLRESILAAASELDHAQRLRMYEDIERRLLDDALVIPIAAYETSADYLIQPWVKGFEYSQYGGSIFHNIWLDESPNRVNPAN